ncbi:DUF3429 domain-containing protein [Grimontia hollisae]|uniref:DUF3429 domain-containing protein n=1 Tax=Grimontia hollisae CIP 101886 TaxID=675812 RepID=D0I9J9_GRIHO|nr:DUF3429 domain-containing protein [Grimontia hollisae]AMG29337.1 DUF3429 domain-containing protein [Grimontia hollisae]EEY72114.1 hypothetical protein VHA_002536 [Grimontia hollisae CIP 101886]STO77672.1 Protein of uncharacterised function (DUF3429) [Grimontia hollisae]
MKKTALIYGALGLIPFVALGMLLPLWPDVWQHGLVYAFNSYSAMILAFLSGAVWGMAISGAGADKPSNGLTVGIVFSLVAVGALLMPLPYSLYMLIASFALLFLLEVVLMFKGVYPFWYTMMRALLTAVVVTCHLFLIYWLNDISVMPMSVSPA